MAMKYNGIIYPNTPFFRKYAGKMRLPAGVEEGDFQAELVPNEVMQEFAGEVDSITLFTEGFQAYFVVTEEVTTDDVFYSLDGGEFTNEAKFDDLIPMDDDFISNIPEDATTSREYFTQKKGWYLSVYVGVFSSPISTGEHTLVIKVKDITIFDGEVTTVEDEG